MTFEVERPTSRRQPQHADLDGDAGRHAPYRKPSVSQENEPVDVPGLGLCYPIEPAIVAVRPDSPAAKAGLKPGDVINSLKLTAVEPRRRRARSPRSESVDLQLQRPLDVAGSGAFIRLQDRQYQDVELVVNNASKPIKIMPEPIRRWFYPLRGFEFQGQRRILPGQGFTQAIKSGYDRTIQTVMIVYSTFRSLAQRRVSPKHLGGPIMISQDGLWRGRDELQRAGLLPGHPEHQPGGAQLPAHPALGRRADGLPDRRESARPAAARFGRASPGRMSGCSWCSA